MGKETYICDVNNEAREAVMRLYGVIGAKVDGDVFAGQLASLDEGNFDLIRIHINSLGGDVVQGMSIVSAMLSMNTPIHVHIDGIAASMAAVVAAAADKIYMMDFSKLMIHDPYFAGTGGKALTAKQQKMLTRFTDMLRQVLSRRGFDLEKMKQLMREETWFSADEAKRAGLCDIVEPSTKSEYKTMAPLQLVAAIEADFQVNNQKPKKMKEVASKLGLQAEATEAEMLSAVIALQEKHAGEVAALTADKEKAEAEVNRLKELKASEQKAEALSMVDQAVKDGKITADLKETYLKLFETDFENTRKALGAMSTRQGLRDRVGGSGGEEYAKLSWDELDRKGMLAELKEKHPDLYEQKYKAMCGTLNIQNS